MGDGLAEGPRTMSAVGLKGSELREEAPPTDDLRWALSILLRMDVSEKELRWDDILCGGGNETWSHIHASIQSQPAQISSNLQCSNLQYNGSGCPTIHLGGFIAHLHPEADGVRLCTHYLQSSEVRPGYPWIYGHARLVHSG